MCAGPVCCVSHLPCVPLPAPGGDSITTRTTVTAPHFSPRRPCRSSIPHPLHLLPIAAALPLPRGYSLSETTRNRYNLAVIHTYTHAVSHDERHKQAPWGGR